MYLFIKCGAKLSVLCATIVGIGLFPDQMDTMGLFTKTSKYTRPLMLFFLFYRIRISNSLKEVTVNLMFFSPFHRVMVLDGF